MRRVNQFFRRLKRLIQFIPHIWRGYDFDYRYAVDLFTYQLGRTADFLESDRAFTISADQNAKRIRTAIKLLNKVYEEEYSCEYQDKLKELYGPDVLKWWFEDTGSGDGSSYIRFAYEKRDNADEIGEMKSKLFKESQAKQERAHQLAWSYIAHNIRNWWD